MTHTQKRILINKVIMILSTMSALIGIGFFILDFKCACYERC
jgi:hypothetical protein